MAHSASCSPLGPKHQLRSLTCCLQPLNGPYWLLKASLGEGSFWIMRNWGKRTREALAGGQSRGGAGERGRGGDESRSHGAVLAWRAVCSPWPSPWGPWMSGSEPAGQRGGREARRRGSHGAAGRRENPEAVNPAGWTVFINDTLKSNRCNKNTVAFSLNMPQRPLVQQPLSIRWRPLSLSPALHNWHLSGSKQINTRLAF